MQISSPAMRVAAAAIAFFCLTPPVAEAHRPKPGALVSVGHIGPYTAPLRNAGVHSGNWTRLVNPFPPGGGDTALLLTDGTIMMHVGCSRDWYRLTPDNTGSYVNGTWTQLASMPSGYTPLYFASAILADGRAIVNGGEYNDPTCSSENGQTAMGALYDPVLNKWTRVKPPRGWTKIGDASSAVLNDGTYLLQSPYDTKTAAGTAAELPGTKVTWAATGAGKNDTDDEEGWTLLQNGGVLTVDIWDRSKKHNNYSEIYSPSSGAWTFAGYTANLLADPLGYEIGPSLSLPDGKVFQAGSNSCGRKSCPGHTGIYNPKTGTWTAGPDFPQISNKYYDVSDGPAAVLTNGNVLIQASPNYGAHYNSPSHFFEFNGTELIQVNEPDNAPFDPAYSGRMVELPTGQVFWSDGNDMEVYTPAGNKQHNYAPAISHVSGTLRRGTESYALSGERLNGVTQGAAYGDDAQMASNYPLVRITNNATGHVCFARTHDPSTMRIANDDTKHSVKFDMPASDPPAGILPCETGASTLEIVTNGLASAAVAVTVR